MEEQEIITKEKSILEKIAPIILIILVIIVGYFGFSKLKLGGGQEVITNTSSFSTVSADVDIEFLNSERFKALKFVPDSPVFNAATGIIPSGRDDPFAPVN